MNLMVKKTLLIFFFIIMNNSYSYAGYGSGDLKRVTFNVAPDDGAEIYVINPGRETATITVNDNTITAAKIQSDAVTTAKILDSNVTTAKIAADAITGAKIADDAVGQDQLKSVVNLQVLNSSGGVLKSIFGAGA